MPFTLRGLSDGAEGEAKQELSVGTMRLGLVECLNHGLLHPYPVLHEKQGDLVAQVGVLGCIRRGGGWESEGRGWAWGEEGDGWV